MDLKHPVFRNVKIEWTDIPAPEKYRGRTSRNHPEPIGATIRAVDINRNPYRPGKEYPGVVVINFGDFDDVPGLEIISEGVCTTTLGSIAIGRQGRFLFWGFTGDPAGMTETGREIFINAVRYLHTQRDSISVPFKIATRYKLRFRCRSFLERLATNHHRIETARESFEKLLVPAARADLLKREKEEYGAWLEENLPYINAGKSSPIQSRYKDVYDVDLEAKALKTPNNSMESLAKWIDLASSDDADQKKMARGCLQRYVAPEIRPRQEDWKAWFRKMKDRIVFCDSVGFYFIEDPRTRK